MTQNIIPFAFKGHEIRTITVDGEPAFVGKDVCERLGYADPTNAMKLHCRGVVKRHPIVDALGRTQNARIIFEPDVLRLIIKSKFPEAEEFERWVFEEVLPSIRKTGSYSVKPLVPQTYAEALLEAGRIAKERDALEAENRELAPQAEALKELASLDGHHNIRSAAQQCGWPERKFANKLCELKWCYRHAVTGRLTVYRETINRGLMDAKNVEVKRTGYVEGVGQPMLTQNGLAKIRTIIGTHEAAMRPFAKTKEPAPA